MDKSKLVIIVGTIFIVIALALSTASVIMMSSVLKKVNSNGASAEEEEKKREVPLSKTTNFNLKDPVIGVIKSSKNPNKTMSISIEIGFNLDNSNKKTKDLLELMEEKEGIIRDRISKLIETKDIEYFDSSSATENLQQEILNIISREFETDAIIEVYFNNNLKSMR